MKIGMINNLIFYILDWAEVWAPLIPIIVLLIYRKQPKGLEIVVLFTWITFFLNIAIDGIWIIRKYFGLGLQGNNPIYNIQSLVRFLCFSSFFINLPQKHFYWFRRILAGIFVLFFFINFIFLENFFNQAHLSENLLTTESYVLLAYCMQYYLAELNEDNDELTRQPNFWIVTGLSIFLVVSFFVFLFYTQLLRIDGNLSDNMWYFHNIAFIVFCIFIAKAFYDPSRNRYSV